LIAAFVSVASLFAAGFSESLAAYVGGFFENWNALAIFFAQVSLLAGPLAALAWLGRIFPHRPLVILAVVPTALSVVAAALSLAQWDSPALFWFVVALDALVLLVATVDLFTLPRQAALSVTRDAGRIASLGKRHRVTLTITNHSSDERFVWVRDNVPPELRPEPDESRMRLAGHSRAVIEYHLNGTRRGAFFLPDVHLRTRSLFGLWQRYLRKPVETHLHVYPDLKQLSEYALLARTNRLSLLGVRRTRRIGTDNEFERLRDYTLDDNYKHIDWRSTARRQKLTVRDFQANQSQRLIFLLDCGRMMTNQATSLTLLDHALNAMLMLSYVALSRGDSVGLLTFSDEIHTYIPPAGGMRHMNRLLHSTFDRFPRLVESRFDQAFLYLGAHCRKRSLVVLLTNVIDEVNANQIERHLSNLVGKHLPLGVLLRDRSLFKFVEPEQPEGEDLFRAAAAADVLLWRRQVLTDLSTKGVLSLDVFPEEMTAPLVNRYLDIKARHLL
jgi:uncharacterized protein (DUF58 family)